MHITDLNQLLTNALSYMQDNLAGSISAGVILLYLLVKRPKMFLYLVLLCVAGVGVMMIFDKISATGISSKDFKSLGEVK
jgi:hypothetical protein